MAGGLTNWAGNVTYRATRLHRPSSVAQVCDLVARATRIRALGTGHSFNRLADTSGELISLAGLPRRITIDARRHTVTVPAGVRYTDLVGRLHAHGYALANLASLPHVSVAGACATATHGSGDRNGTLATAVRAVELVTAGGGLVTVRRDADGDRFAGTVVGLGALGVVTHLTLDLVPAFDIRQYVYDHLPWAALARHWAEIFASGYSVSLFIDWTDRRVHQVWRKRRVDPAGAGAAPARWLGATLADGPRHPIPGMPAAHCTGQLGVPGPWHARLPHFRAGSTPSRSAELQSEYLVPRHLAIEALSALDALRDRLAPLTQVCEIRTVAADDLWLSPAYRRDSVGFHFTWVPDEPAVTALLPELERRLAPLDTRPHWGKLFQVDPDTLGGRYPRWSDFAALLRAYDPAGTFRNELIDRYFPAG